MDLSHWISQKWITVASGGNSEGCKEIGKYMTEFYESQCAHTV